MKLYVFRCVCDEWFVMLSYIEVKYIGMICFKPSSTYKVESLGETFFVIASLCFGGVFDNNC